MAKNGSDEFRVYQAIDPKGSSQPEIAASLLFLLLQLLICLEA